MNIIKKIKELFTNKKCENNDVVKFVVYYYDKWDEIGGKKYWSGYYPDLITIMYMNGIVPSIGEACRLFKMGKISACVNGSICPQKVPIDDYTMNTSNWIYKMRQQQGRKMSDKYIIDKGVILYKGTLPFYIEFRKADSLETYVKQLEPFKRYLKGEIGNRYDYSTYSLDVYAEAIRQIKNNG